MPRRGIIHVHSTFSYDGQNTLGELAAMGKSRGYSFIGMTEHSDTFDHPKMAAFVQECRSLSDASFVLIPGIEFSCGPLHLLGLGLDRFTESTDPVLVTRFIQEQGGLAAVAHPSRYRYQVPEALVAELDGIEVWNASYDSRFVPDRRVIELWRTLLRTNGKLMGFGGQDLHRITSNRHVSLVLPDEGGSLAAVEVLGHLRSRSFAMTNGMFTIRPDRPPGPLQAVLTAWAWRAVRANKLIRRRLSGRRA